MAISSCFISHCVLKSYFNTEDLHPKCFIHPLKEAVEHVTYSLCVAIKNSSLPLCSTANEKFHNMVLGKNDMCGFMVFSVCTPWSAC